MCYGCIVRWHICLFFGQWTIYLSNLSTTFRHWFLGCWGSTTGGGAFRFQTPGESPSSLGCWSSARLTSWMMMLGIGLTSCVHFWLACIWCAVLWSMCRPNQACVIRLLLRSPMQVTLLVEQVIVHSDGVVDHSPLTDRTLAQPHEDWEADWSAAMLSSFWKPNSSHRRNARKMVA